MMYHQSAKVNIGKAEGFSKQRDAVLDTVCTAFVDSDCNSDYRFIKIRNHFYAKVVEFPRTDVEGATYVGLTSTMTFRHYRDYAHDKKGFTGRTEFQVSSTSEEQSVKVRSKVSDALETLASRYAAKQKSKGEVAIQPNAASHFSRRFVTPN